jgi:outer membrane usher protein
VLEVSLSEKGKGESFVVLRGPGGSVYLDAQEFSQLRLHLPKTAPKMHDGHRYFSPADIPGAKVTVNETRQRAVIEAPADAFEMTRLSAAEHEAPKVTPASPGAFLNYQFSSQQIQGHNNSGAYAELGTFAAMGVLTSTTVARDSQLQHDVVRLDTTFTRDFPETLHSLNLGDAISDPGSWGNAVRFAGIRWSKNFSMRPDLLTSPLLSAGGTAAVPSTVDVFVNNQLVSSSQLPAGPFIIDRLPSVSGTGDVSVVVRDALGREQVMTQSFYSSVHLLAPGLTQYSVNLGKVREDYALSSNHYGALLAEGSYRRGITKLLTLEGHAEYLANDAHAAGINAVVGVGKLGTVNVTAAAGGDARGSGMLSGVGFEHHGRVISLVANTLVASGGYSQVSDALNPSSRFMRRSLMQAGINLGRAGSLSMAYVQQSYRLLPTQRTVSLTHSLRLGASGALNLTLSRSQSTSASTSFYLLYVLPFGNRRSGTLSTLGGSGEGASRNEMVASVMESPPVGPGFGYRLSASTIGNYDADWRQQFSAADLELQTARNSGVTGQSAYLDGALTLLDGKVGATRSVTGSFAVVDVAGLAGVPVYVENQLTTHTDANGKALLFNLRPYEANRISIAPEDLPLDTTIGSRSTIMAPPFRSGVVARFPVERVRSATFRLVTPDGKPLPAGADVSIGGATFPVVLDGMVYITGYDHGMSGDASWGGTKCRFRIESPVSNEPLPDLGTVRCKTASASQP